VTTPRVSIVVPAYNESSTIGPLLQRLSDAVRVTHEIIVVIDSQDDETLPAFRVVEHAFPQARIVIQDQEPGPANAIRFGFRSATAPCVVVTMADGSDDVWVIDHLVRLVERGCAVAAASRYMSGGAQIGGPRLKKWMSQTAGLTLNLFAGVSTKDPTNSFKAYSVAFVNSVGIDSNRGFEIALELTAKAKRLGLPIAEIPTIWLDREAGVSNFQMRNWLPEYLKWYRFAYGRRLSVAELRELSDRNSEASK